MVSKEEEQEAKLLCSYCNSCSDCKECNEWELYLDNYSKRLKYKLRDYKLKLVEYARVIFGMCREYFYKA